MHYSLSKPFPKHFLQSIFVEIFLSVQVYVQVNKEAEHNEDMKQAARDFFKQLEQHESEAVSLWQQFREITVDEYQHVYKVQPATRPGDQKLNYETQGANLVKGFQHSEHTSLTPFSILFCSFSVPIYYLCHKKLELLMW